MLIEFDRLPISELRKTAFGSSEILLVASVLRIATRNVRAVGSESADRQDENGFIPKVGRANGLPRSDHGARERPTSPLIEPIRNAARDAGWGSLITTTGRYMGCTGPTAGSSVLVAPNARGMV
jgi:hypothetical protein